jgi:hypothetical protein
MDCENCGNLRFLIKRNQELNTCAIDSLIDYKIDVLRFAWKTSKTIIFKKLETVRRKRKNERRIAPDRKM